MKSPAITATVVNGIILDRLDIDALADFAAELWEEGAEAHRDEDHDLSADLWAKYQTVCAFIDRFNA